MTLYNHPSYFESGEINSRELSPLPTCSSDNDILKENNTKRGKDLSGKYGTN